MQTAQMVQVVHDNTTSRTATEVTHANNVATLAQQTLEDVEASLERAQELDSSSRQKVADVEAARTSVDDNRIDLVMTDAALKTSQAESVAAQVGWINQ